LKRSRVFITGAKYFFQVANPLVISVLKPFPQDFQNPEKDLANSRNKEHRGSFQGETNPNRCEAKSDAPTLKRQKATIKILDHLLQVKVLVSKKLRRLGIHGNPFCH
jgi:hypothetical protein